MPKKDMPALAKRPNAFSAGTERKCNLANQEPGSRRERSKSPRNPKLLKYDLKLPEMVLHEEVNIPNESLLEEF